MSFLDDPRVLFAAERTLMAWNRTALALIGFGFGIERFGLFLGMLGAHGSASAQQGVSLWMGVAFVLLGIVALMVAARQYLCALRTLGDKEIPPGYWPRSALLLNGAVALMGLALLVFMLRL
ncbi:YidH family protein [Amphibiibacter pelophylacis]|uniref:DUF202 domain-containing protein n=1 Tax=Amphibiibacter pelophylacis TaxID=1799477 RepID=A0ACC6NZ50_9BURK